MSELNLYNCRLDRRYDIRVLLGRGSYAEIFLGIDRFASPQSPHSSVVVKALNVFLQDDLDADLEKTLIENFQNEAVLLDKVRHPNIISRLGHGSARDLDGMVFHYLVLEYLSGGDLQKLIRSGALSFERAFTYIEQICSGLSHAHRCGVIHRDIKPQNILLTADIKTVKIADFGVARMTSLDRPITRVGTNIYAPPEHSPMTIRANNDDISIKLTPAADIYSLAKTVYALITAEVPRSFSNSQISTLPETLKNEPWSRELLKVLRKATDPAPDARHQNVDEFWNALLYVRQMLNSDNDEKITAVSFQPDSPRPHVSRGYTPMIPRRPAFSTKLNANELPPSPLINLELPSAPVIDESSASPIVKQKKNRALRSALSFVIFIVLFTGILYATHTYISGIVKLPDIFDSFRSKTAVTSTDVYLRPSPNTDNDPIGLVTKNSRIKIIGSSDNWYHVAVLEQGRVRNVAPSSNTGWLNGKFIEIDDN